MDNNDTSAPTEIAANTTGNADDALSRVQRYRNQYAYLEIIAKGGMGIVFKGRHIKRERVEALKIIAGRFAQNPKIRERFNREAAIMQALKHPNIIDVFEYGEDGEECYLAMEYINGPDLEEYRPKSKALNLKYVVHILEGVASALDYAHSQGVIHRDVKPSNVLLRPDADQIGMYSAILTDFGIVKILDDDMTSLTTTGSSMGTWWYMGPEQISDSKRIDHRTDIYAMGAMAYELLTTQLPFNVKHIPELIKACLNEEPNDPRTIVPGIPEASALAVLKALSKKPEDRFDTAGEFVEALKDV